MTESIFAVAMNGSVQWVSIRCELYVKVKSTTAAAEDVVDDLATITKCGGSRHRALQIGYT